ncbi:hypothetical protein LTS10_012166 [Elasticomyces elasticus]|nr:hypothetical protein LTS10_012166 [Elasticomyces elasticus]
MQAYPEEYAQHNLPLVFLSGLGKRQDDGVSAPSGQENGTRVSNSSAECSGDRASQLLDQFVALDGSKQPWNSQALPGPSSTLRWRMRAIGRRQTFTLLPRKAAPLPQSPNVEGLSSSPHRSTELHSPLSPQSPGSPIYPDGVFTKLWFAKHQRQVPALLIAFFEISADEGSAQNEQIQIDINAIRTALGRSGFKTRFAAVLMSEQSILRAPELEDRLIAIRRATTLDTKTGLFFMPPMTSQAEIATFVQSMLTALQPLAVEHYRELTKKARRKKIRLGATGSLTSPVDGGAHALSTPGWNVRYEVKQGVFAEFRQEMDVAERHYSAAIEELFNSEGVLETTPSWSPRWDEARLLCDVMALRVLRCELWSGLTTSAAVSWTNYKARMKDLIDRRGKGTQTYSWDAWESRWAEIMAQLIQRTAVPGLRAPVSQAADDSVELVVSAPFAPAEKTAIATDRLPPFHLLHHPGYWLRLAVDSARSRWLKALAIPEEDQTPPGQSPASAMAHRAKSYDTFLVAQPHEEYPHSNSAYDHIAHSTRLTDEAIREFGLRSQGRATTVLNFELAQQLAAAGEFEWAMERLLPVWDESSWRSDDWDDLLIPTLSLLHDCARRCENVDVHIATAWELLGAGAASPVGSDGLLEYLQQSWSETSNMGVRFEDRQRLSPLAVRFAFRDHETHVGDRIECQLALSSQAAPTLRLSQITMTLSNGKTITITHTPERAVADRSAISDLTDVQETADGSLMLEADLQTSPNALRVYSFKLGFREAGVLRLQRLSLKLSDERFSIEHVYSDTSLVRGGSWYVLDNAFLDERPLPRAETTVVMVHPKPPKMRMTVHGLRKQHYLGETMSLDIELVNDETEPVDITAVASAEHPGGNPVALRWQGQNDERRELAVGKLDASATHKVSLQLIAPHEPTMCVLTLGVGYFLLSDTGTPLSKTTTIEISVIAPFEAKFNFGPLLHSDVWPSYFAPPLLTDPPQSEGIPQKWRLGSLLRSAAADTLLVHAFRLAKAGELPGAECTIQDPPMFEKRLLEPEHDTRIESEFVTTKISFDDRRPTNMEFTLHLDWSRDADSEIVTVNLVVPRLNLPSSEPRVLCTTLQKDSSNHNLTLQYHIENPSGHFLTFALTMEANEDFAFSGPKFRTLSVAPISRVCVQYRLLVHGVDDGEESDRWISPVLQVVDSYYNKALRVHSGGPRVKIDEKGSLSVLVAGSESNE